MTFDRADYESLLQRDLAAKREAFRPEAQRMQQAAVAAERLTGTPEWDYFLSIVQSRREDVAVLAKSREEIVLSATDAENRAQAHLHYREARAQLAILDWVLDLPKTVIESGKQAAAAVADVEAP